MGLAVPVFVSGARWNRRGFYAIGGNPVASTANERNELGWAGRLRPASRDFPLGIARWENIDDIFQKGERAFLPFPGAERQEKGIPR